MGRRKKVYARHFEPDAKYNNVQVGRFINYIMKDGKKTAASKIVYTAFDIIQDKTKQDPIEVFESAINKVAPILEIKSKRVGGATYQVPMEVAPERRVTLAMRWIITASRNRAGKSFSEKLAGELMDAAENQGASIRRREETHKMAEANRAFSHFRM